MAALAVLAAAAFAGYQLTREDPVDDPTSTTAAAVDGRAATGSSAAATASCTASKSRDSTGNVTTYEPELVNDGDGATAWRCDSDGIGERLVLQFPEAVRLTSVGLIPGHRQGRCRRRHRPVRAEQQDRHGCAGRSTVAATQVEQSFEATPALQRTSVDVTTRTVTIEILRVVPGTEVENDDGVVQPASGKSPIAEVELRGEAAG